MFVVLLIVVRTDEIYNFPMTVAEGTATADPNDRGHYSYGGGQ
jgi:hypothetical protein